MNIQKTKTKKREKRNTKILALKITIPLGHTIFYTFPSPFFSSPSHLSLFLIQILWYASINSKPVRSSFLKNCLLIFWRMNTLWRNMKRTSKRNLDRPVHRHIPPPLTFSHHQKSLTTLNIVGERERHYWMALWIHRERGGEWYGLSKRDSCVHLAQVL